MDYLSKDQIFKVYKKFNYRIGSSKKEKIIELRRVVGKIKGKDHPFSESYISRLLNVFGSCRMCNDGDLMAYLSILSEQDIVKGRFPKFDSEKIQAMSNQAAVDLKNRKISRAQFQSESTYSHLPQGHQTILGVGNIIGKGISIAFIVLIISMLAGSFMKLFE